MCVYVCIYIYMCVCYVAAMVVPPTSQSSICVCVLCGSDGGSSDEPQQYLCVCYVAAMVVPPPSRSSICVCVCVLCGSDGGSSSESQQYLLAVLQGSAVSHSLQRAFGLGQQSSSVTRRR